MKTILRPQFWIDLEAGVAYLAEKASPEIARRWHSENMATVAMSSNDQIWTYRGVTSSLQTFGAWSFADIRATCCSTGGLKRRSKYCE